jgi:hypothetical protein
MLFLSSLKFSEIDERFLFSKVQELSDIFHKFSLFL